MIPRSVVLLPLLLLAMEASGSLKIRKKTVTVVFSEKDKQPGAWKVLLALINDFIVPEPRKARKF